MVELVLPLSLGCPPERSPVLRRDTTKATVDSQVYQQHKDLCEKKGAQ